VAYVALIDRKSGDIVNAVETDRIQFTIDALMRNRDPKKFVARELKISDSG